MKLGKPLLRVLADCDIMTRTCQKLTEIEKTFTGLQLVQRYTQVVQLHLHALTTKKPGLLNKGHELTIVDFLLSAADDMRPLSIKFLQRKQLLLANFLTKF